MRIRPLFLFLLFLASTLRGQLPAGDWALAWSDEFSGSSLDTSKWGYDTSARRDARNTTSAVSVANGAMTITTYTESGTHKTGFVGTSGKFTSAYGYWEARIRFTSRDGMWSAFWIQSPTINNTGNNPNANGTEIDVVEHRNRDTGGTNLTNRSAMNVHWDGYAGSHKSVGNTVTNPGGTSLQGNWHNYGLLWEPGINRFYVDGVEVWSQTTAVSQINQFIYLTSEVENGAWAGPIPSGGYGAKGSSSNAKMEVDFVRHWRPAAQVSNGSFSGRVGNWGGYGTYNYSGSNGLNGGSGLRVNPGSGSTAAAEQTVYGLTGGLDYVFTGWGRVGLPGTQTIQLGVKNFGGSQVLQALSGTEYAFASVPFSLGMDNTSARVFAYVPTSGDECFADDLRIRPAAAFADPGFESGDKDASWSPYGDTLVHSWAPVRSGGQAFRFNNPNADRGMEQQLVGLSPSTSYKLSCWMRGGGQPLRLGVKNHGAAEAFTTATANGNVWTRFEHAFATGAAATTATAYAFIPAADRASVLDLDDFFVAEPLSAGWTAADIGAVGLVGEAGQRGPRTVLRGAGSDIWGTADSFRFVHSTLAGDGVVRARLRSFTAPQTTAKFGVMLRASLDANAPHLYLGWRADQRMETVRRLSAGAASNADLTEVDNRAEWVRVHRSGNTFTAAYSADGVSWLPLGTPQTVVMPATIYAGLAGTSSTTSDWMEGSAENLAVIPNTAPTLADLPDLTIAENGNSGPIPLVFNDVETAASGLILAASSTDTGLVPASGLAFTGAGAARSLVVTPASGRHGVSLITVIVDDGTLTANRSFLLTVSPPAGGSVSVSLAASADDAEESAAGVVSLTSTDLELTEDGDLGSQIIGLRFAGLAVPAGAVITDARIQFKADEVQTEDTLLSIAAQLSDNATTFTTTAGNLSSRPVTSTTVAWNVPAWNTAGEGASPQRSPALTALVQEIVSRPGWASGNAIAFLVTGNGHRTAEAKDKSGGTAPRLTVDFVIPQPVNTLTRPIGASADDAEESSTGTVSLTSTDLELINDTAGGFGDQTVGLRFTNITLPKGAFVHSATVQFSADEVQTGATTLTFRAEASDNPSTFTTAVRNISSRSVTAASATWSPSAWNTIGQTSSAQTSADLSRVIQEIVNRPGWISGNGLVLIITGTGRRTADSFDDTNPLPPVLTLTYSTEKPASGYDVWLQNRPSLDGVSNRADDPDGDGLSNLLEYALGTDPLKAGPAPHIATADDGGNLYLTYTRPSLAQDLSYLVEASSSPAGPWSEVGVVQQVVDDDGSTRTMRARVATPVGGDRQFLRLRAISSE